MKRKALYPLAVAAAAAALFLTGTSLRASEADDKIESSFKKTYVYQTYLKDDAVKAEAQKELTTEYAKDIDGVKGVKNEMKVAGAPEQMASTGKDKIDDASITAQVKMALFTHRSTSALKTRVVTRDGQVTVSGVAKNGAEKSLVGKLVEDVHGVTSVKNEMTVE